MTAPKPCPQLNIKLCGLGFGSSSSSGTPCTDPVAPFDAAAVRCFLDAYIANTPARLAVSYTDTAPFPTHFDRTDLYVLLGDGTVSIEEGRPQDPQLIDCKLSTGKLRDTAYLTACKASTTDAELLACFDGAIQPGAPGAACTKDFNGCHL